MKNLAFQRTPGYLVINTNLLYLAQCSTLDLWLLLHCNALYYHQKAGWHRWLHWGSAAPCSGLDVVHSPVWSRPVPPPQPRESVCSAEAAGWRWPGPSPGSPGSPAGPAGSSAAQRGSAQSAPGGKCWALHCGTSTASMASEENYWSYTVEHIYGKYFIINSGNNLVII